MNLNQPGIYKITNIINGKAYIGLAKNIQSRWNQHKNFEMNNFDKNLYWAFQEYGIDNFKFEAIQFCPVNMLARNERKYIKEFDTYKNGYNSSPGGEGASSKTLSDKYEIQMKINFLDVLTYESAASLKTRKILLEKKKVYKLDKFGRKILKFTDLGKDNKVTKFENKVGKYTNKMDSRISPIAKAINNIEESNKQKYEDRVEPFSNIHVGTHCDSYIREYSPVYFTDLTMLTLKARRYQRNNVKYKVYENVTTKGEVKFTGHKLIFKPEGIQNASRNLEDTHVINVSIYENKVILSFDYDETEYNNVAGNTFKAYEDIPKPRGYQIVFHDDEQVHGFLVSFRKYVGV